MTRTLIAQPQPEPEHRPIQCLVEMLYDGTISVVVRPGCSVADVHDMLQQLTLCDGNFEHLTIVDEDEPGNAA